MFQVLLESGAHATERSARWTAASAFVHAALIASAVMATVPDAPRAIEYVAVAPVRYVVPRESVLPRQPESAITGSIGRMLREMPTIPLPAIHSVNPILTADQGQLGAVMSLDTLSAGPTTGTSGPPGDGIYEAAVVDRTVVPRGDNIRPEYPTTLRASAVEGDVQVRFVVDSAGNVEPSSIEIVRATHPLFATVVRRWLPSTRYVPAEARGRRVRQLVEQRVGFTLRP
jgi:hypothetical protein